MFEEEVDEGVDDVGVGDDDADADGEMADELVEEVDVADEAGPPKEPLGPDVSRAVRVRLPRHGKRRVGRATYVSASVDSTPRSPCAHWHTRAQQFRGHTDSVYAVAVAPGGDVAASGGGDDVAYIWEVATGRMLHALRGHGDSVVAVAFDHTGRMLATGSYDQTVKASAARVHMCGSQWRARPRLRARSRDVVRRRAPRPARRRSGTRAPARCCARWKVPAARWSG